jgi:hypothetical protein
MGKGAVVAAAFANCAILCPIASADFHKTDSASPKRQTGVSSLRVIGSSVQKGGF